MKEDPNDTVRQQHATYLRFRGELVRIARRSRGYRLNDLARKAGITQEILEQIEDGLVVAVDSVFERLAEVLQFPLEHINPFVGFGPNRPSPRKGKKP